MIYVIAFVVYSVFRYIYTSPNDPIAIEGKVFYRKPNKFKPWIEAAIWLLVIYLLLGGK